MTIRHSTTLTMTDPPVKQIPRISDAYEIAVVILKHLRENHGYVRDIKASQISGYPEKPNGTCVWLESHFKLSDIRTWTGRSNYELDDELLVSALETLSVSGEIRVTEMRIREEDRTNDMSFAAVLGAGVLETFHPWNQPHLREPIWFSAANVHKFGDPSITEVLTTFKDRRTLRDKAMAKGYPTITFELESKLHLEKIMDDMRMKKALDTVAAGVKDQK